MNNDLISRSALKKDLQDFFDKRVIDEPADILHDVFCYIDNAPTVETEVITLKPMTDEMTQDLIDKINTNVGMAQAISEERR